MSSPAALSAPSAARVLSARNAVFVAFAMNGGAFAAWASRIPDVKLQLGLTAGQLGLLLLAMSAGAVIGLPSTGWLAGRYGAATAVRTGVFALTVGLLTVAAGIDLLEAVPVTAVGLFLTGLGMGVWDVGMNLEGVAVEQLLGRTVMPRFHAAFSGGTVVTALAGAGLSAASVPVGLHLAVAAVVVCVASLAAVARFLPREAEEVEQRRAESAGSVAAAWRDRRTLLIGAVVMVAAFTEGSANDWLSVALVEGHDLEPWAGILGFAVFLTCMTAGRLWGGAVLDRHGRVPVLRLMLVVAGLGSLLVVFGSPAVAFVGAAIWGLGISLGFPVGMSAAADDPAHAAARMSVVSSIAYTAFLAGPPFLGFLGDAVGILHALLAVGAGVVLALLLLPALREPDPAERRTTA